MISYSLFQNSKKQHHNCICQYVFVFITYYNFFLLLSTQVRLLWESSKTNIVVAFLSEKNIVVRHDAFKSLANRNWIDGEVCVLLILFKFPNEIMRNTQNLKVYS